MNWKKFSDAVARKLSVKKIFFEISQNWQENTCVRVNFIKKEALEQVFSREYWEISKKTLSYRTAPGDASEVFFCSVLWSNCSGMPYSVTVAKHLASKIMELFFGKTTNVSSFREICETSQNYYFQERLRCKCFHANV